MTARLKVVTRVRRLCGPTIAATRTRWGASPRRWAAHLLTSARQWSCTSHHFERAAQEPRAEPLLRFVSQHVRCRQRSGQCVTLGRGVCGRLVPGSNISHSAERLSTAQEYLKLSLATSRGERAFRARPRGGEGVCDSPLHRARRLSCLHDRVKTRASDDARRQGFDKWNLEVSHPARHSAERGEEAHT